MAFQRKSSTPWFAYRLRANLLNVFILSAIALAFAGGIPLWAQYTTGSLGGTVEDPAGAVVPGAVVTVQNEGTGLTRGTTSQPNGEFLFPTLPIGHYKLSVTKPGFTTYVQTGIVLTLNQAANQIVRLTVGAVTQQVTVSANATVLTTRTGTVSQLISQRQIVELPLNGRQAQSLLFLAAGTVNETGKYCLVNCQGGVYPGEQDGNVSGTGPRSVNYQLDGAGHNDAYLNTNLPFPNPDAVQEFNVQKEDMSAQYGLGGAVVNIVTKSGTNQFHGDVFEFLRNGALNARNFFAPTQDTLKRNQFGGSVGGPIMKNKLFFFFTYQGTRIRSSAHGEIAFVPTADERNGNFSDIPTQLVDPSTGTPFTNNQIPTSMFSGPTNFFLQHMPLPQGPGRQLTFIGPSVVQNDNQWMPKIDWNHGKNQLSGSYFWTKFTEPPDIAAAKTNILAADGSGNQVKIQDLSLNDTYSFSPTLLFNTWFGWDSQTGGSLSGAPFGFPDAGVQIAAPKPPELNLGVSGFFSFATNHLGYFNRGDWTVHEDVTMQRGSHELHFGGDVVRPNNHLTNTYRQSGGFTFGNALSGSNLVDFMLGHASAFTQGGGEFKDLHGYLYSLYAQDNWRLSRKLTVNLGLRWDPYWPFTEEKGRVICWVPGAKSNRFPNAPIGVLYGGPNADSGCPSGTGSNPNLANIAPRLGFAYRIGSKTVVRGGAGIYFTPYGMHDTNGLVDTAPFSPQFSLVGDLSFVNPYASAGITTNPFPAEYAPTLPTTNVGFTLPMSIYGVLPLNWQEGRTGLWNLTVERQFRSDWLFRAGYVGNLQRHASLGGLGNSNQLNPAIYIPGQSTEANTQSRRIYPNFGSVGQFVPSDGNSNYNALELTAEKRFNHGFQLLANYTWSKMIDNFGSSGQTDPFNIGFDYGTSNDSVANVFNFSGIWQLPKLGPSGFVGGLVNGWQLTSIATWHSGFPFSVFSGKDNSFTAVGHDRADFTGNNLSQARLDPNRSHGQLIRQYFNTGVFAPNAVGTFGSSGKNILFGPGLFDTDVGLLKNTKITEGTTLQFRAEFFNLFNNVNFSQPNSNLASSSVGTITSAGDPRILQFALKLSF